MRMPKVGRALLPVSLWCAFIVVTSLPARGFGADTSATSAVATDKESFVQLPTTRGTGLSPEQIESALKTSKTPAVPAPLPFDDKTMMRSADVRPGMKGYGLSVFSGIKPEKFDAEVVGVRHGVYPKQDIILCKLTSPYLVDIGVIAGMSGSPVYLDGRVIGAVAYGWMFAKEPLAGVTPIENMLDVFNSTSHATSETVESARNNTFQAYNTFMQMRRDMTFSTPRKFQSASAVKIDPADIAAPYKQEFKITDQTAMEPLATPLFISGASPATMKLIGEAYSGLNVQPISDSMASAASGGPALPLSAGAMNSPGGQVTDIKALSDEISGGYGLGVPFIEGDMSMAGVGTVTYRNGDRLVAFGHPMFEEGSVEFPMAAVRINGLSRNIMRPFKVGESVGQIGVVRQDRIPAIGGVFGEQAPMFGVRASVDDPKYQGKRDYKFRLWNNRDMTPQLCMTVIAESIAGAGRGGGDTAAWYDYAVAFDDGTSFTKEEYIADSYGGMDASYSAGADIGVMMNNPYKPVKPASLDFHMKIADKLPQAIIRSAATSKPSYRPGDMVEVTVEIQPYRKEVEKVNYSFKLPDQLPEGSYDLSISDGSARASIDYMRDPGSERVFNYESLVSMLKRNYPKNKIYLTVRDRDTGVSVRGNEMPKLPASVINTIQSSVVSQDFAQVAGNFILDADIATSYQVSGNVSLTLTVARKE